jgi:methenyltetrahydromethanopterin cyclohydrolase
MGRTNDAINFGGRVHLFVSGPRSDAAELAAKLPSSASRDYGAPFAEVFRRFGGDFYAIDPMLFSPAAVAVTALESGETFRGGAIAADLLDASFLSAHLCAGPLSRADRVDHRSARPVCAAAPRGVPAP